MEIGQKVRVLGAPPMVRLARFIHGTLSLALLGESQLSLSLCFSVFSKFFPQRFIFWVLVMSFGVCV